MEKKKIKRDIMLIATLIIVCAAVFLIINFVVKKDGITAAVKVDGNIVYMLPLDKNASVTVEGYQGGSNTVVIENGTVYMKDADCPDKLCEKTGKISKNGETIVCLPHRVVVEIQGGEGNVDSLVR
ncbi:MAG: NusG domain II-containing protein [Lachnospira sp.]|nr:NusG domain II-containing protein [Lachnospira sp.]